MRLDRRGRSRPDGYRMVIDATEATIVQRIPRDVSEASLQPSTLAVCGRAAGQVSGKSGGYYGCLGAMKSMRQQSCSLVVASLVDIIDATTAFGSATPRVYRRLKRHGLNRLPNRAGRRAPFTPTGTKGRFPGTTCSAGAQDLSPPRAAERHRVRRPCHPEVPLPDSHGAHRPRPRVPGALPLAPRRSGDPPRLHQGLYAAAQREGWSARTARISRSSTSS